MTWTPRLQSLARIIVGFLVLRHGMEQVFGFPAAFTPVATASLHGVVKLLALPGGILLMLGLFTRPVCVVLAPLYVAVWTAGPLREAFAGQDLYLGVGQRIWGRGPTDPLLLPALFFTYLFAAGPGPWSLDALRNPATAARQLPWAPHVLGVLRITAGVLFLPHGIEKFFGRVPVTLLSLRALAGTLECVGGPLLAVGLFTRPLAFLLSGEMAFAYFINHAPDGFWGSFIEPNQEASILYCFLFLFLSAAGSGSFSLEGYMKKRAPQMDVQKLARLALTCMVLLLPSAAWAQSSISGIVQDTSGAVLPGVTVEAASPALIEGVRSAVTDSQGLYRIVDLRPGAYTITFTLPGFRTLKRDGFELQAAFAAMLNAQLPVGALEETVTVSGQAPTVDVQSSTSQVQFEKATIEALPGAGRLTVLSDILPGATLTQEFNRGVGGTSDRTQTRYSVHGGPEAQPYVDGMNQQLPNSTQGVFVYNQLGIQEVVVETSGVGADRDSGGMQINMVPKDGGNVFSGVATAAYSGPDLATKNITPELLARHLDPNRVGSLKKFRDTGAGIGGPIRQNKLWFFTAAREGVTQQFADGVYWNKAKQSAGDYSYTPDLSRPASTNDYSKDLSVRLTLQASQKNKFSFSSSFQNNCNCVFNLLTGGRVTPEAAGEHGYVPNYNPALSWTSPISNRVLLEAGASAQNLDQHDTRAGGLDGTMEGSEKDVRIVDQGLALTYGNANATRRVPRRQYQERFAISYITGAHSFKTGVNLRRTSQGNPKLNFDKYLNGLGVSYRFSNGVPNQLTLSDAPWAFQETLWDTAFFVQDQWTVLKGLTLNLGVRFNNINASTPEQILGAGFFVPERILAAKKEVPHYRNFNPRLGAAYDLFGNGRTALKFSLGQYPEIIKVATGNPANNLVRTTTRTWADANRNFVPDCALTNPVANGECGPWSNLAFGQVGGATRYSDDALSGFNAQYGNWQSSISLQHELRPGIGVTVGYYRTSYGGTCGGSGLTNTVTCLLVTDNLRVTPADFAPFSVTAPTDPRLPTSGQVLTGFYDVRPALFGQTENLARPVSSSDVGQLSRVYNGFDVTTNARFGQGGMVSGGLSMGRTVTDNCLVVDSPQDARPGFCKVTPPWSAGSQVKFLVVYPLPWDISTSMIYQNSSGIPVTASYVVGNAAIAPSLGRNLSDCGTAAACNANRTVELIAPQTMFEPRLQQVDLRFSRVFRFGGTRRLRPSLDVYNLLNASNVINENITYGPAWRDAVQILSGRLLRIGAQLDF